MREWINKLHNDMIEYYQQSEWMIAPSNTIENHGKKYYRIKPRVSKITCSNFLLLFCDIKKELNQIN